MDANLHYFAGELIVAAVIMLLGLVWENGVDAKRWREPWKK